MKLLPALAIVATALTASEHLTAGEIAKAQSPKRAEYTGPLPPSNFRGRRWSHPNGCDYSLAGRRGERVWYVVVSTLAGKDCVRYFVEVELPESQQVTKKLYRYH